MKGKKLIGLVVVIFAVVTLLPVVVMAFTIDPYYAGSYKGFDLGSVPGVPSQYGGLTLKAGDPSTLLIGGTANYSEGQIYAIGVTRGAGNHITGFSGSATVFATAPNIDGGLQYGPGGVLFFTGYNTNEIGEIKPGSSAPDKTVNLDSSGITSSVGGLAFVPGGFPGAGQLKIVSYNGGGWYTAGLSPDVSGTYNITGATFNVNIGGGPEGIAYVPLGSPRFTSASVLISQYDDGKVSTYAVDTNGDPIGGSKKDFITGLTGVEGAFIDPLTGDFLFSTFGGGDHVIVVQGFNAVPLPPTLLLLGSGLVGLVGWRRFRKS
jgi:hypothetical protein